MFALSLRTGAWRQMWLAAAFLLLAFRMLSPSGFMPQWQGQGFSLRLCDGFATAASANHGNSAHDPAHYGDTDGEDEKPHDPCPYAAASGQPALLLPPLPPFIGNAQLADFLPWPDTPALLLIRADRRPGARAPPLTA